MLGTVIFSVWPHLCTWGPSPSFVAFIWAFRIARALKGFHTATNTLSKLAELSLHLRCKTRSKGKKEPLTAPCRWLLRSVDLITGGKEKKHSCHGFSRNSMAPDILAVFLLLWFERQFDKRERKACQEPELKTSFVILAEQPYALQVLNT